MYMYDCHRHLVYSTCDNEVGVAISIRDPYTVVSPSDRKSIEARTILFAQGPRPSRTNRALLIIRYFSFHFINVKR